MKTQETLIIEEVLLKSCFGTNPQLAKDYGTTEVTVGFARNHNAREIVDFLSYDPAADIFRCYEIKVSMEDFYSRAAKSWHGNYNYLVLTEALFSKRSLEEWEKELPQGIGIIVIDIEKKKKRSAKKASRREIEPAVAEELKNSLIRTLFYQNQKLKRLKKS